LRSVGGELDDEDIYENRAIWNFRCKAAKFWVKYGRFNVEAAAMDGCSILPIAEVTEKGKLFGEN
jgi:hypothetical protein